MSFAARVATSTETARLGSPGLMSPPGTPSLPTNITEGPPLALFGRIAAMRSLHWVKNTGQFPAPVAWVAALDPESGYAASYHGSGVVLLQDESLVYLEAEDVLSAHDQYPEGLIAMASSHELVVLHGTPLAAALNIIARAP